jgi:hypothetical protein
VIFIEQNFGSDFQQKQTPAALASAERGEYICTVPRTGGRRSA